MHQRITLFNVIVASLFSMYSFGSKDTLETKCDTIYYHRKPLFGETEELFPLKITCYYVDSNNVITNKKASLRNFKDGELHGAEIYYYYSDKVTLINFWGRPFKREPKPWRKKFFGTEVPDYSVEYKGYWQNGKKHGAWTYYNPDGSVNRVEEYKKGSLVVKD